MDTLTLVSAAVVSLAAVCFLFNPSAHAQAVVGGPCQGCRLFNWVHREDRVQKQQTFCHYPCQCPVVELQCHEGVSRVRDGCGCCFMCSRQLGDMCNVRDRCDEDKGFYCSTQARNETGECEGRNKKPCNVLGTVYNDGEKFYMGCAQLCTCQNGFYGCVSQCPQEEQKPSSLTCKKPQLIEVKNKCCKEWICPKLDIPEANMNLHGENLVAQNPHWYQTTTDVPPTTPRAMHVPQFTKCHARTTDWTPCTVTCGVGMSVRTVVDQVSCHKVQERQVCYLRPCGKVVATLGRDKCTPTTRTKSKTHVRYMDCFSIRKYKLKFCTNCRKNRCCYPQRSRAKTMEFQCAGGQREVMTFQFIKKCKCTMKCYQKKRGRGKKRGKKRKKKSWNWRKQKKRERRRRRKML